MDRTVQAQNDAALSSPAEASEAAGNEQQQLLMRVRPHPSEQIIATLAMFSPLLLLVLWEIVCRLGLVDTRFVPAPTSIAGTFANDWASGEILEHVAATLRRVAVGYAMGAIPALMLALFLGLFKWPRQVLVPIFNTLYTVPKVAIFPLLLLFFGLGDMSKFVLIAIGVFFLVFFNTLNGVLQIPSIYFDVARNAGASLRQILFTVAMPAALPSVFTGLKLAVGNSYVLIAASEFVGAKSGVGFYIWNSWQLFSISRMFVGIVLISLLGYLSILLVEQIQRRVIPYAPRGYR